VSALSPDDLERMVRAIIERLLEAEAQLQELQRQVHAWEIWANDPALPLPAATGRLGELERALEADNRQLVERVIERIRTDPALREQLRGPRGIPGLDGDPGPPGDAGSTVIREVRISG
jgi:hypothetical protein